MWHFYNFKLNLVLTNMTVWKRLIMTLEPALPHSAHAAVRWRPTLSDSPVPCWRFSYSASQFHATHCSGGLYMHQLWRICFLHRNRRAWEQQTLGGHCVNFNAGAGFGKKKKKGSWDLVHWPRLQSWLKTEHNRLTHTPKRREHSRKCL